MRSNARAQLTLLSPSESHLPSLPLSSLKTRLMPAGPERPDHLPSPLANPDLLRQIFFQADSDILSKCLRVSKAFCEVAASVLYHTVNLRQDFDDFDDFARGWDDAAKWRLPDGSQNRFSKRNMLAKVRSLAFKCGFGAEAEDLEWTRALCKLHLLRLDCNNCSIPSRQGDGRAFLALATRIPACRLIIDLSANLLEEYDHAILLGNTEILTLILRPEHYCLTEELGETFTTAMYKVERLRIVVTECLFRRHEHWNDFQGGCITRIETFKVFLEKLLDIFTGHCELYLISGLYIVDENVQFDPEIHSPGSEGEYVHRVSGDWLAEDMRAVWHDKVVKSKNQYTLEIKSRRDYLLEACGDEIEDDELAHWRYLRRREDEAAKDREHEQGKGSIDDERETSHFIPQEGDHVAENEIGELGPV